MKPKPLDPKYEKRLRTLAHYGTPRHSGRYPWGSGENPYQGDRDFLATVHDLKTAGVSEVNIAKSMGMSTTILRKKISLASTKERAYLASEARRLRDKGLSPTAIGKRMGKPESSVRSLLNESLKARTDAVETNANILKEAVESGKYIDVGKGTNELLGISDSQFSTAVELLKTEGYTVHQIPVKQLGTGKTTNVRVLTKADVPWAEAAKHKADIKLVTPCYSEDGGKTARKIEPPSSIDSKRVYIRYNEDGGKQRDGTIELRRGVEDISLGKANYAQVRIAVDGSHYMKGMAFYSDDIPDGYDIVYNTNKHRGTEPKGKSSDTSVFKPMKSDPDNPFGANIKGDDELIRCQRHYTGSDGKEHLSKLNIVSEEGTWDQWSRTLSSQFMSKQNPSLAKKQLSLAYSLAEDEYKDIMSLTNPTVRNQLLMEFASQCDSDAVHLRAAALPRQSTKVILPITTLKANEIYAPGYRDGEQVALIRHPHAGSFEIPVLTVNNKNKLGKSIIGNGIDAVGIRSEAADQLSGADFDGDSVILIPCDNIKIKSSNPLPGLKDFDHKEQYAYYEGMHIMTPRERQMEMGSITNLITDMTFQGAPEKDIEMAVKHSMVVIDAEKHHLDYKQSAIDNHIAELKRKYQGGAHAGAHTLLSRATSEEHILDRKEKAYSKMTPEEKKRWAEGYIIWEDTGAEVSKTKKDSEGNDIWIKEPLMIESKKLAEREDAYDLVSRDNDGQTTRMEAIYADWSNEMKQLARDARAKARQGEDISYSPEARKKYQKEYDELKAALRIAKRNSPLERQAQIIANAEVKRKIFEDPTMDSEHVKKLRFRELDEARNKVGAGKQQIKFTSKQWEAINSGAISKTFLKSLLQNADPEVTRALATPRTKTGMTAAKIAKAKSMLSGKNPYTQAEVADYLGVSVSTLVRNLGL